MTTVAFIIFSRAELTRCVFEKIRSAKSAVLLVVADSGFLQQCRSQPRLRAAKVVRRRAGGGQLTKHPQDQEKSM